MMAALTPVVELRHPRDRPEPLARLPFHLLPVVGVAGKRNGQRGGVVLLRSNFMNKKLVSV